jgi:hypothetical protein
MNNERGSRSLRLVGALALAGVSGCGGGTAASPPQPAGLGSAPAALTRACARERVACPRLWPRRLDGRPMPDRAARALEPGVLIDVANGFCRRRCHGVFHADVGQQPRPFGPVSERLRFPTRTHSVPMRGGGRFVDQRAPRRLATTRVAGARAAVYLAAPYPQGGLHGGHVVVLWNAGGRGHLVSLHSVGLPRREVVRLAVAVARSEPS